MTVRTMARTAATDIWIWLTTPPDDVITEEDRRTIELAGLELPIRASVAVVVAITVLVMDLTRVLLPPSIAALGRSPEGLRGVAIERLLLLGIVPLMVVVLGFRDRVSRYGMTLGDRTAGLGLLLVGVAAMTPVVLWYSSLPDVRAYYAPSLAPVPEVAITNALDLTAAEFLFRGFLMFTLVRAIGPLGVLISVMPFAFAHTGKPALELLSTLGGGLAYGWLAWRTRSIVWGAIAHVYIMTLLIVAMGGSG